MRRSVLTIWPCFAGYETVTRNVFSVIFWMLMDADLFVYRVICPIADAELIVINYLTC